MFFILSLISHLPVVLFSFKCCYLICPHFIILILHLAIFQMKAKIVPVNVTNVCWVVEVQIHSFLTAALYVLSGHTHAPPPPPVALI
jgi:hypothetical protein